MLTDTLTAILLDLTAVTAIEKSRLKVTDSQIKNGAEKAFFPARLQLFSENPKILLDGAHNPDGVKALKEHLEKYFDKPTAIIGMMKDKDVSTVLSEIAPLFSKIITVTVNNPRSLTADELAEKAEKYCDNVMPIADYKKAILQERKANEDFVICGSFYLCSDALKILED